MNYKKILIILILCILFMDISFAESSIDTAINREKIKFNYNNDGNSVELVLKDNESDFQIYLEKIEEWINDGRLSLYHETLLDLNKGKSEIKGTIYRSNVLKISLKDFIEFLKSSEKPIDEVLEEKWILPRNLDEKLFGIITISKFEETIHYSIATSPENSQFEYYFDNSQFHKILKNKGINQIDSFKRIELEDIGRLYYFEYKNGNYIIPIINFEDEYEFRNYEVYQAEDIIKIISDKRTKENLEYWFYFNKPWLILVILFFVIFIIKILKENKIRKEKRTLIEKLRKNNNIV